MLLLLVAMEQVIYYIVLDIFTNPFYNSDEMEGVYKSAVINNIKIFDFAIIVVK